MAIKTLLVDDHELVIYGMKRLMDQMGEVTVLTCRTETQAISAMESHPDLDLVILDLDLGHSIANGYHCLSHICTHHDGIPVIIVSAQDAPENVRRSFELGARGFITKRANSNTALQAIHIVLSGGLYVPDDPDSSRQTPSHALDGLTTRQKKVLDLLSSGLSNKSIANQLGVAETTVRVHMAAIFRELGVRNRTEAALKMRELDRRATRRARLLAKLG